MLTTHVSGTFSNFRRVIISRLNGIRSLNKVPFRDQPITGTVTRQITGTTLPTGPTGPVERTLDYTAPFTLQNRETDYATVWQAA